MRLWICGLLSLFLLGFALAAVGEPAFAQNQADSAEALMQAGKYKEAIALDRREAEAAKRRYSHPCGSASTNLGFEKLGRPRHLKWHCRQAHPSARRSAGLPGGHGRIE